MNHKHVHEHHIRRLLDKLRALGCADPPERILAALRLVGKCLADPLGALAVLRLGMVSAGRVESEWTLGAAAERYMAENPAAPKAALRAIVRVLGAKTRFRDLTDAWVEARFNGQDWSVATKNQYWNVLRTLCRLAQAARRAPTIRLGSSPFKGTRPISRALWSIHQVVRLLLVAIRYRPDIVPHLALELFAGLDLKVICGLRWEHFGPNLRSLTIPAELTFNCHEWHLELPANLAEFLRPFQRPSGPLGTLAPKGYAKLRRHLLARAGLANDLRVPQRMWMSHRLALVGDHHKVLNGRHQAITNATMQMFATVTQEEGEWYFGLRPPVGWRPRTDAPAEWWMRWVQRNAAMSFLAPLSKSSLRAFVAQRHPPRRHP